MIKAFLLSHRHNLHSELYEYLPTAVLKGCVTKDDSCESPLAIYLNY